MRPEPALTRRSSPAWAAHLVAGRRFQAAILAVIVANALLVGAETSGPLVARYGEALGWLNAVVLAVFVAELILRIWAHWPRPLAFFADGWNWFDFVIIAISLVPEVGPFATVARLARLLRAARLVSVFPELRLIISTMLRSIPSMGHVVLLLSLLLYIYGVLGYHLFSRIDPEHWGSLGSAVLTLFQVLTLEGWVELQKVVIGASPWAWVYFASFIVVAVFVVVNLFIAIVINNLEAAKAEHEAAQDARSTHRDLLLRAEELRAELARFEQALRQP